MQKRSPANPTGQYHQCNAQEPFVVGFTRDERAIQESRCTNTSSTTTIVQVSAHKELVFLEFLATHICPHRAAYKRKGIIILDCE